jgi:predicted enzyme related to lactoylglutathione lyase
MNKTIVHFEIPADDVEKLKEFYEQLFGWKFIHTPMPEMDYWLIHTVPTDENGMTLAPGINGGMYKKENEMQKPTNWITVEDIDSYMNKVGSLGGTLIMEKMKIPGVGWTAMGLDPEGNQVAMLQPEM